jgi:ATP-binding protein involved in chromosome partitioning
MATREAGDEGHPIALEDITASAASRAFLGIATQVRSAVPA